MRILNGATVSQEHPIGTLPLRDHSDIVSRRAGALALVVVLILVFVAYLDTLWFQFVLDDKYLIVENTWLRSWHYLPRYFTSDIWAYRHPLVAGNFYRPLFLILFRVQYLLFGLHTGLWHLSTVLAHVGVTALYYFMASRLLKDRVAGLFAAVIFGLYPVHVEAVAWVTGITESLVALLMIASFLCYLRKRSGELHARRYLVGSLLFYVLALLSKEMAIVLPAIIFGSELIWNLPGKGPGKPRLVRTVGRAFAVSLPYLVITGAYLPLRMRALRGFQNPRIAHSFASVALTWPSVLWFYIRHLLWPVGLSSAYGMDYVTHPGATNFWIPGLLVLVAVVGLWYGAAHSKEFAVAALWLILPLLPALNLWVLMEGHFVADRYLHLPALGFGMIVAWGLRRVRMGSATLLGQPAIQVAMVVVLGTAFAVRIPEETAYFTDRNSFYTHLAAMEPQSEGGKVNLAALMAEYGHLDAAIQTYAEIRQAHPDDSGANYNLGYAYYLQGNASDADRYLRRAAELDQTHPESFFYLGLAKLKLGDVDGAATVIQHAIFIRPDGDHYHFALGVVYRLQGKLPAALAEFRREIELDPENASARQQAAEVAALQAGQH